MTDLDPRRFDEFFNALHEYEPFDWQRQLARRVADAAGEGWPEVLALPTASGKTAVIEIAIFALSCQAALPPDERTAPRRIFFVVDRRVIVDEAFERARRLAKRLREAREGILAEVATALLRLSADQENDPLACFQLRGGLYRDDAWARTPTQPTVVASTVDQLGSRLLFRTYGRSSKSWPLHAGLAANDSLVLLDEAHCAKPFGQTLRAVGRYRGSRWADRHLPSPFAFVEMTATPLPGACRFELPASDREHPVLGRRIDAPKSVRLADPIPGDVGSRAFVAAACKEAERLAAEGARRIAILVNRVDSAKRIHGQLAVPEEGKTLLTGRMRPLDKDEVMETWKPLVGAAPDRPVLDEPVFVVATQCLEVGANLDFDAMVSECASLDALRQRFGRLDRFGDCEGAARGVLLVAAKSLKEDDFVYGDALRATWGWLGEVAVREGGAPSVDFGIAGLDRLWETAGRADPELKERVLAPSPDAPVMLPAHVDRWVQTAPAPQPDPDPGVFLHGPDRNRPEVQVCWRADLEPEITEEELADLLSRCPPASPECLPVPLVVARRWLAGEERVAREMSDVEGGRATAGDEEPSLVEHRVAFRWRGPDECGFVVSPSDLRPGDTLVLPLAAGGWDELGYLPAVAERDAVDRGDEAHVRSRDRAVLRVHPRTVAAWPAGDARELLLKIAGRTDLADQLGSPELDDEIQNALDRLSETPEVPSWFAAVARHLADARGRRIVSIHPGGIVEGEGEARIRRPGGLVLSAPGRVDLSRQTTETFSHEDESASSGRPVPLDEHGRGVAKLVRRYAESCGLDEGLAEDLALAGRLHDLGKADLRFQAWLHDGNTLAAAAAKVRLAKSGLPQSRWAREQARKRAGYPRGGRHELLSVRLVESAPALLARSSDPDLVLHLIGCHHGHCRPFAPAVADPSPHPVRHRHDGTDLEASSATGLERLDSGVAERFWRLVRRYGWWGLAYLEAIFLLADHRLSELEETRRDAGDGEREEMSA